jgi:hypothetical protein
MLKIPSIKHKLVTMQKCDKKHVIVTLSVDFFLGRSSAMVALI